MDEYIERKIATNVIGNIDTSHPYDDKDDIVEQAIGLIDHIPAADVEPVRHGEWVACGDGNNVPWMCSHCGKITAHEYKMMYGNYCPNCGARMEGGSD